ncbi:MAG: terminase large subunit, partial [Bacteroidales bacterium]
MSEKIQLSIALRGYPLTSPHLLVDDRLLQYVKEVINNESTHNYYEQLAVKRFLDFLYRKDLEFRPRDVKRFIVFYESLRFEGKRGPTRYKLTPVQVFQFTNIFGFYNKDTGYRLCREALLFVPRKFSKTTSVASIALFDVLFGDTNAQAYVAANSYDQADICFTAIKNIVKSLDTRGRNFKTNRERIFNLRPGRTSFVRCLAKSPDKLDGLNASCVIVDEYAQADNANLKNVLTSSMGARDNPLTIVITTASSKMDTPFIKMLDAYKGVLKGAVENDSIFAHIFEPDKEDEYSSPNTWYKVQPHLGVTVNEEFYKTEWRKAMMSQEDMVEFKCKLLNVFARPSEEWLPSQAIQNITRSVDLSRMRKGLSCMVAIDLSIRDDMSAVCYTVYDDVKRIFYAKIDYYLPEGVLANHPNAPYYRELYEKGHLKIIPGEIIDSQVIINDMLQVAKYVNILQIGYDPYKSLDMINSINAIGGAETVPVKQTYGAFTSSVEMLEQSIFQEKLVIDSNPLNQYCFNNAVIDEDKLENRKPIKKSKNKKIDGVI